VRETRKRNTTDNNTSEETAQHNVEALKLRIQELETENARLREELAALTL
jgi:hypothetical protein